MKDKIIEVLKMVVGVLLYIIGMALGIMWGLTALLLSVDLFGWSLQTFMRLIGG